MFCKDCGTKKDESVNTCVKCKGTEFSETYHAERIIAYYTEQVNKRKEVGCVISVVATIVILFILTIVFTNAPWRTKYDEIKMGMTYQQVVNIMGSTGMEYTYTDTSVYVPIYNSANTRYWILEDGEVSILIMVVFQNNKVVAKGRADSG